MVWNRAGGIVMTYFITGVSRGLGRFLAGHIASIGHRVIGTVRADVAPIPAAGSTVETLKLDLADDDAIRTLPDRIDEPIDVLINNAGINDAVGPRRASPTLGELPPAHLREILSINAVAPLLVTQALLPNLRRGNRKTVIFVSSDLASLGRNVTGGRYGYRMSKACLNMAARTLAVELAGEGFIIVAMNPGWVRTDMGGPEAPLSVEESGRRMVQSIEALTPADNGRFLDYDGRPLPW